MIRLFCGLPLHLADMRLSGNVPITTPQQVPHTEPRVEVPESLPLETPPVREPQVTSLVHDAVAISNKEVLSEEDKQFVTGLITRTGEEKYVPTSEEVSRLRQIVQDFGTHLRPSVRLDEVQPFVQPEFPEGHLQRIDPERRPGPSGPPLSGLVQNNFGEAEESLRSTFWKSSKTINKILDGASDKGREMVLNSDNKDELIAKLKAGPTSDLKNEIARSIGALRSDKYGADSSYNDLSANKRALVDAIYKGMMSTTVSPTGNLDLTNVDRGETRTLGAQGRMKEAVTIDGHTFNKDDRVVVIEKDGKTYLQAISAKDKATGTGELDIEVKPNLYELKPEDKSKVAVTKERFQAVDKEAPLFPGPISVSDIKQGAIGDCYLIAGIYAIAKRDPQAIHNMIKDNGDGTVTVRLYDKGQPQYVTFDKSVREGDAHAGDSALWVQMLEKAYAVQKGSYEGIAHGGHTNDVFTAFLGQEAQQLTISSGAPKIATSIFMMPENVMSESASEKLKGLQAKFGFTDEQLEAMKRMSPSQLMNLASTINQAKWPEFTQKHADFQELAKQKPRDEVAFSKARDEMNAEKGLRTELQTAVGEITSTADRKGAMEQLLAQSPSYVANKGNHIFYQEDYDATFKEIKDYARNNPTITHNGKSFDTAELIRDLEERSGQEKWPARDVTSHTGVTTDYTDKQNELFKQLTDALKAGKYVAVGSQEEIGVSQGRGHSGGESVVNGLAGQHAYALLDTVEMNGRQFVRIANPWGSDFSRDYTLQEGQLVSKRFNQEDYNYLPEGERRGAGIGVNESWIELRELSTLFSSVYVTK